MKACGSHNPDQVGVAAGCGAAGVRHWRPGTAGGAADAAAPPTADPALPAGDVRALSGPCAAFGVAAAPAAGRGGGVGGLCGLARAAAMGQEGNGAGRQGGLRHRPGAALRRRLRAGGAADD